VSLHAQHYLGVGLAADMPFTHDRLACTRYLAGGGGEISGFWQYQYRSFLLQTGVAIGLQMPRLAVEDAELEMPMVDTRGMPFLYRGYMKDRTDMVRQMNVVVPLLLGYGGEWFYVLTGVRYHRTLSASSRIKAELMTAGDYYGRYYDWFTNMPNHGYHDYITVSSAGRVNYTHEVQVVAEAGMRIKIGNRSRSKIPNLCHVGVWAAYGLLDAQGKTGENRLVEPDYSRYMQVEMTHAHAASDSKDAEIHNLFAGIRVCVLFPVSANMNNRTSNRRCHCLP
jgi:hypothetical protein